MAADRVLLFTDIEGSTKLTEQLGDAAASTLWTEHDRIARQLMRKWHGQEIDKTDGFLILFEHAGNAAGFALEMHASFGKLVPPLRVRAGIHSSSMVTRQNTVDDVTHGAKPVELDGVGKAVASRVMSIALGGQTLLSAPARAALESGNWKVQSHGHWRMKGVAEPVELFELADVDTPFTPPPDSVKAFRVVQARGGWIPLADLPHSLPAERDPFVGRTDALESLAGLFHEDSRLVTVLGIGGIGKTRLALRYASTWLGEYLGGAWFCDLSAASNLDGIVLAVAQGLDVPLGKADPVQQLGAAIAGRGACLVILDNFEQVARHAEATIGHWLEKAPQARFLVTSREVLGISGEETFVLAPLPSNGAVHLFEIRAKAAHPLFSPAARERDAIEKLVELLDRLPLAIELAAARIRVMRPSMMLERMDDRFKLLASVGGRRERQATLRATLDWSWDLLTSAERSALTQLSVFEGGFSLATAEAVVQLPVQNDGWPKPWLPDVLQALVEKSLLRPSDGKRFDMLRTVQEYAASRLDEGVGIATEDAPSKQTLRRHWSYFAALSETTATADRCAERENLMVACRRAAAGSDIGGAIGALANASAVLQLTGPFRALLELVRTVESATLPDKGNAAVLSRVAGTAHLLLGQAEQAHLRFEQGLNRARETGDVATTIRIVCLKTNLAGTRTELDAAAAALAEALSLPAMSNDARLRFRVLSATGALRQRTGQLADAIESYRAAMDIATALEDKHWQGGMYGNLGLIALTEGRLSDARTHLEAAVICANEAGDRQWEGNGRCNLGLLLYHLDDSQGAANELERALFLARSMGYRRLEATVLCNLGIVTEACKELATAYERYVGAVALACELKDDLLEAQFRGYLGLLLSKLGRSKDSGREFTLAATKAEAAADPGVLAMLNCQRAIAAAQEGDESGRQEWLTRAERAMAAGEVNTDVELRQALSKARTQAATIKEPS